MADVFITYSTADQLIAQDLVNDLRKAGFDVSWDDELVRGGGRISRLIRTEIAKCKAVVVIWSATAVESDWVYGEAKLAGDRLVCSCVSGFDPMHLPVDFLSRRCELVTNRLRIFEAIERMGAKRRLAEQTSNDSDAITRSPVTPVDAAAQVDLGFSYENGFGGLTKDDQEAVRLYKLAADQGNADGQNKLGNFYRDGRGGLARDDRNAARLYMLAANQGNANAQYNLGDFYRDGRGGLPQDDQEAARLYMLARFSGQ